MPDPIIEAVARALCVHTTGGEKTWGYPLEREWYRGLAVAAIAAVSPLIRAATLEEAAKVADDAGAQEYEAYLQLKAEGNEEKAVIYAYYTNMAKVIAIAIRRIANCHT